MPGFASKAFRRAIVPQLTRLTIVALDHIRTKGVVDTSTRWCVRYIFSTF